jgi:hypothetical protein
MITAQRAAYLRRKESQGKKLTPEEKGQLREYQSNVKRGRPSGGTRKKIDNSESWKRFLGGESNVGSTIQTDGGESGATSDGPGTDGPGTVTVQTGFPDVGESPSGNGPPPISVDVGASGEADDSEPGNRVDDEDSARQSQSSDEERTKASKEQAVAAEQAVKRMAADKLATAYVMLLKWANDEMEKKGSFAPLNMANKYSGGLTSLGLGGAMGDKQPADFLYMTIKECTQFVLEQQLAKTDINPESYAALVSIGSGAVTGAAYFYDKYKEGKKVKPNETRPAIDTTAVAETVKADANGQQRQAPIVERGGTGHIVADPFGPPIGIG